MGARARARAKVSFGGVAFGVQVGRPLCVRPRESIRPQAGRNDDDDDEHNANGPTRTSARPTCGKCARARARR